MRRLLIALLLAIPLAAEPRIEDLRFMSGHWGGAADGLEMEEVWLEPKGGLMTGTHRDVKGGRAVFFEFLRISEDKEGIVYHAQPLGRPPTPFRLVELISNRAVFANPEHDFPQRIIYELREGKLCARVEGPPNEKDRVEEWCWAKK